MWPQVWALGAPQVSPEAPQRAPGRAPGTYNLLACLVTQRGIPENLEKFTNKVVLLFAGIFLRCVRLLFCFLVAVAAREWTLKTNENICFLRICSVAFLYAPRTEDTQEEQKQGVGRDIPYLAALLLKRRKQTEFRIIKSQAREHIL